MTFTGPSILEVPSNKAHLFDTAWASDAAALMIDLEDSLPVDQKEIGRAELRTQVLASGSAKGKGVAVRANAVDSPWFRTDVEALQDLPIDLVALPMVSTVPEIQLAVRTLDELLGSDGPDILLVVETPGCVVDLRAIVAAAEGRIAALLTGGFDFTMAMAPLRLLHGRQHVDPASAQLDPLAYNRLTCLAVARAFGILAFDGLRVLDHKDQSEVAAAAALSRLSGFDGCVAYAPAFITAINEAFVPSADDLEWAQEIVIEMQQAHARGRAAAYTRFGTALPHHFKIAQRLLAASADPPTESRLDA